MVELRADRRIMATANIAFLEESGGALVKKYAQLGEELFTEQGWRDYAQDLLERMTNEYLADRVERAGRDVLRKLGRNDRLFGTMGLVLEQGIEPKQLSVGALAALAVLGMHADEYSLPEAYRFAHWRKLNRERIAELLRWIWGEKRSSQDEKIIECVWQAKEPLGGLLEE